MIILGIDPGTAALGYGIVERNGGRLRAIDYGCLETSPDLAMPERLLAIHAPARRADLSSTSRRWSPSSGCSSRENAQTAHGRGQARGVVLLAAAQHGRPVREATPNEVKSAIAGYGAADKEQVQRMVQLVLGMSRAADDPTTRPTRWRSRSASRTGSGRSGGLRAGVLDRAAVRRSTAASRPTTARSARRSPREARRRAAGILSGRHPRPSPVVSSIDQAVMIRAELWRSEPERSLRVSRSAANPRASSPMRPSLLDTYYSGGRWLTRASSRDRISSRAASGPSRSTRWSSRSAGSATGCSRRRRSCSTAAPGSPLKLHTYHLVREDQQALYGFRSAEELGFFTLLLTVTGVGPEGRARDRRLAPDARPAARDHGPGPGGPRVDPGDRQEARRADHLRAQGEGRGGRRSRSGQSAPARASAQRRARSSRRSRRWATRWRRRGRRHARPSPTRRSARRSRSGSRPRCGACCATSLTARAPVRCRSAAA